MKIKTGKRTGGVTMIGALAVGAVVVGIGIFGISCIIKASKKADEEAERRKKKAEEAAEFFNQEQPSTPTAALFFPPFPALQSITDSNEVVFIPGTMLVIERSTNLVDWEPIFRTSDMNCTNIMDVDTNKPWPCAFYRGCISIPTP